jgi:two-component system alkaline phosphatase synthesis response regulator PhoP
MAKRKILVIDDELCIVEVIKEGMGVRDYEVISANNGFEGFKKAQEEKPDIILLDIVLPGMHGFEVCKKLKDNSVTKKIPVIIMTGGGFENVARDEPDIQAEAYLAKPFDVTRLTAIIDKVIIKD